MTSCRLEWIGEDNCETAVVSCSTAFSVEFSAMEPLKAAFERQIASTSSSILGDTRMPTIDSAIRIAMIERIMRPTLQSAGVCLSMGIRGVVDAIFHRE